VTSAAMAEKPMASARNCARLKRGEASEDKGKPVNCGKGAVFLPFGFGALDVKQRSLFRLHPVSSSTTGYPARRFRPA